MAMRRRPAEDHENHERWLLTYSDMITLLLALFIVLYSISVVNTSKFKGLQQSLRSAFSSAILTGGHSVLRTGSSDSSTSTPSPSPIQTIVPLTPTISKPVTAGTQGYSTKQLSAIEKEIQNAQIEQSDFVALQHRINAYARAHGWSSQVHATIEQRGLVVTVLTDGLLYSSGSATLHPAGYALLDEMATLINIDPQKHPVVVEGYTDDVPIHTPQFPSNWQLSSMRASNVAQYLVQHGVAQSRLSAAGYADQYPIASFATAAGRAKDRRVEIVFERKYPPPTTGS